MCACNFNARGGAGGSLSANMMDLGEQISLNFYFLFFFEGVLFGMPEQKDTDVSMVSLLRNSLVSTVRLDLSDFIFVPCGD